MGIATEREIEFLFNHPEIRQHVAGVQYVSAEGFYKNPGNVAFRIGGGVLLFEYHGYGVYEAHFLFPPYARGSTLIQRARRLIQGMLAGSARVVWGQVPLKHRRMRFVARALGAEPVGRGVDALGRACIDYEIRRA